MGKRRQEVISGASQGRSVAVMGIDYHPVARQWQVALPVSW